ncbi:MAG: PH domain-containing protein [Candidatus Paceibacterota bacterium]
MEEFDLQPGEHIMITVRQHPFVLAMRLLPFLLLALVPDLFGMFFSFVGHAGGAQTSGLALSAGLTRFLTGFYWLILWIGAFTVLTKFALTQWIITNVRIVDIKQYGFFSREVSSFLLLRVQDVTTEIYGVLPTLIGYGKLNVETAGNIEKFTMDTVSHPQRIRDIIMDQVADLHATDTPANTDGL